MFQLNRVIPLLLLLFILSNAQSVDSSYFKDRKAGATAALGVTIAGIALDYGVSLPMALNGNMGGAIGMGVTSGVLQWAGTISGGVAASRSSKMAIKQGVPVGRFGWGLFVGGCASGVVSSVFSRTSTSIAPIISFGVLSDLFMIAHNAKAN